MTKTVLMVEDDDFISEVFRMVLEKNGYEVIEASNGSEALDILHTHKAPAVILLDLNMPVMDGRAFLNACSFESQWRSIPVIVSSGEEGSLERTEHLSYIRKPVDIDELIRAVALACA